MDGNAQSKAHILISEGDTCFRNYLYEKAVAAYSEAIEIQKDREILLQRSRCYVQLGMSDKAIDDASEAIAQDNTFYRGFYQKGEAYYSAGQFEYALVYYYRAYRRRPDIQAFRLGVQKAEESILRALDACVGEEKLVQFVGRSNVTTKQMIECISQPEWPQAYSVQDMHRCLCGCPWCNYEKCGDLYEQTDKGCYCRCEACIRHCAVHHGVLPVPQSANNEVEQIGVLLGDIYPSLTATPATATPATAALLSGIKPTQIQQRDEIKQQYVQQHKKKNKTALDKDKEFLLDLKADDSLAQCANVNKLLSEGIQFIDKRSEFWRSYGNYAKSRKTTDLRRPPKKLHNINVRINTVDFYCIIQNMQNCQTAIQQSEFDKAHELIENLDEQLQNVIVKNNDEKLLAEKAKILSDVHMMAGCLYFEEQNFYEAAARFQSSYEVCYVPGEDNQLRGLRNALRAYFYAQSYDYAIDSYLQLYEYISKLPKQFVVFDSYRAMASCLKTTRVNDEQTLMCAFNCMDGLVNGYFDIEKSQQIHITDKDVEQFNQKAPNWYNTEDKLDIPESAIAMYCLKVVADEYDKQFYKPRAKLAWAQVEKFAKECGDNEMEATAQQKQKDDEEDEPPVYAATEDIKGALAQDLKD